MQINAEKMFQGLPDNLNFEQQKIFAKLDELRQDLSTGFAYDYSDTVFSGGKSEFLEIFYDVEKKKPYKYFGYDHKTGTCSFCEYEEKGPEKQMMNYEADGFLHIEKFRDGIVYEEIGYKQGQLTGHVLLRYPNGNIKEDAYYRNGKRDQCGTIEMSVDFREDGTRIREANYKDGHLDGLCIDYYENDEKKEMAQYVNGKKEGTVYKYDIHGNVTGFSYRNGQEIGTLSEPKASPLISVSSSFSVDEMLARYENQNIQTDTEDIQEKTKILMSDKLASVGEKVYAELASDLTNSDSSKQKEEMLKSVDAARISSVIPKVGQKISPPPPPVISKREQAKQASLKEQDSGKESLPIQVLLRGKGRG